MGYIHSKDLELPPVLADGGYESYLTLDRRLRELEEQGFGDGISGKMDYHGHHADHQGLASLISFSIRAEYDSDDDLKAMVRKIDEALTTEHSRVLWFT